jgi:hypothetical protein
VALPGQDERARRATSSTARAAPKLIVLFTGRGFWIGARLSESLDFDRVNEHSFVSGDAIPLDASV